jgi:hypothetical protein
VDKLVRLAEIYAEDFDIDDLTVLPNELKAFMTRFRRTQEFLGCTELGEVTEIMETTTYQLVYRLIGLTLILPVIKWAMNGSIT